MPTPGKAQSQKQSKETDRQTDRQSIATSTPSRKTPSARRSLRSRRSFDPCIDGSGHHGRTSDSASATRKRVTFGNHGGLIGDSASGNPVNVNVNPNVNIKANVNLKCHTQTPPNENPQCQQRPERPSATAARSRPDCLHTSVGRLEQRRKRIETRRIFFPPVGSFLWAAASVSVS